MNLAEHPLALDLAKRISSVDAPAGAPDKTIPVQIFFPDMGQLMGACRMTDTPGLFAVTTKVQIEGTGQSGVMEFFFTCDKVTAIIHPNLKQAPGSSSIIQ